MKSLYYILLLILTSTQLSAQCKLTGFVKQTNNKEIPYALVKLLSEDSIYISGATTDSTGHYQLNNITDGHYQVLVSCIGYKTKSLPLTIQGQQQATLSFTLQTDEILLGEVEVKGSSFIRKDDHLMVIPGKQQVKHAGSGYDLLYNLMIPGIDVDKRSGKVTALNNSVTLYIDGRKASTREVQVLRPRDVEKVEYYDAPSGRFSGDITSINYITKKYKTGGYVVLDAKQGIGYLNGDYNMSAKVVHNNTSHTLFAGHNYQSYNGNHATHEESAHFQDYDVLRNNITTNAGAESNGQYVQWNIQRQTDKKTLVSKLSLIRNKKPEVYSFNQLNYNGQTQEEQLSHKQSNQKGISPSLAFYGNFKLSPSQYLEASLSGSYADNGYTYNYNEGNRELHSSTQEDMYELDINMNYGIRFKHNNSLTAKLYHLHKVSMSDYRNDKKVWQHLWTGETLLFAEYNHLLGKGTSVRVSPGVSCLQYKLHKDNKINQVSPRLQLAISHKLSMKQFLQLRINVGNSFPTISMMNKVEQAVDFLQVKRGNADMETTKACHIMSAYALHLGKINIQAVGMYQFYKDMYVTDYFTEQDRLIQTYRSDVNWQQMIGMLSVTWKPTQSFHVKADGNYTYSKFYRGVSSHLASWSGNLQLNYYWRNLLFNVYGKTTNRALNSDMAHVHIPTSCGVSVNWNLNDWSVEVCVDNPFSKDLTYRMKYNSPVYQYRNLSVSKLDQTSGYIKINYTFDFLKKVKRDKKNINTEINSAILKAD